MEKKETPFEKNEYNTEKKRYKIIPKENDVISFPEKFSTDDKDEYDTINLLNEDKSKGNKNGWDFYDDKDNSKIYHKIVKVENEGQLWMKFFFS